MAELIQEDKEFIKTIQDLEDYINNVVILTMSSIDRDSKEFLTYSKSYIMKSIINKIIPVLSNYTDDNIFGERYNRNLNSGEQTFIFTFGDNTFSRDFTLAKYVNFSITYDRDEKYNHLYVPESFTIIKPGKETLLEDYVSH